jgi:hypothetical protein
VFNWGWVTSGQSSSVVGQNGFLAINTGHFTADSRGTFSVGPNGLAASQQSPVLYGDDLANTTYDRPYGRWLPASPGHVLRDESAYGYELQLPDAGAYEIHLVQVASAADRVVYHMPYNSAYSILAFQPEGVYLVEILHRSGLAGGLSLLDPKTASLKAIPAAANATWQIVDAGAAWGGPGGQAGDSLTRLDLKNGVVTTWFQHAVQGAVFEGSGYGVSLIGFDASARPLVEVFPPGATPGSSPQPPGPPQVWLVKAPGDAVQLSGIALPPENALNSGVSDSKGLWLVGADGVYLYAGRGFRREAPLAPQPTPNHMTGGDCA